jgi:hypothetical protein
MLPYEIIKNLIPIRQELRFREEDGVGIVNSHKNIKLVFLNHTALIIFKLIDSYKNIDEICKCFIDQVDVNIDIIQYDIVDIIRNLQWHDIIRLKDNSNV